MAKKESKKGATAHLVDWKDVRKRWEEDPAVSFSSLGREGIASRQTISKQAKAETWTRVNGADPAIRKAAMASADAKAVKSEVLAPELPPDPPGVPSQLAEHAAIERRAQIIDRHRRELNIPRNRLYQAMQGDRDKATFDKLKEAKISAEALSLIQSAERKAWGLDGDPTIVFQVIPPSQRDKHD